ncbi:MAG TPA: hypothetical protein VN829_21605 [Dongiaceae bacterium]|nr:hypothetical protein [Dongiaceae bacterium]
MKHVYLFAAAGALLVVAGCASNPNVASIPPVGPAPGASAAGLKDGSLQVYSARDQTGLDPNLAERLWDENFGEIEYLDEQPHTDYALYSANGEFLREVRNASASNPAQPELVSLPPGLYQIQAKSEERGGEIIPLTVPVVIKPGERTAVHLEGDWKPLRPHSGSEVVRLPDGRLVGWVAQGD